MNLSARLSFLWLCWFALFASSVESFQTDGSWKAQRGDLRIQKSTKNSLPFTRPTCSSSTTIIPATRWYYSRDSTSDGEWSRHASTTRQKDSQLHSSVAAQDWQSESNHASFLRLSSPVASSFSRPSEIQFRTEPSSLKTSQQEDCQQRIQDWADLYTSVEGLRNRFGHNSNRLWGDLDAVTARRLYHTLLPSALLWLAQTGVQPQDLAPLAYQARKAAKLYIRERSQVPFRVAAHMLDGFRQFRKHGKFQTQGMTYEQIWQKYRNVILDEKTKAQISTSDSLKEEDFAAQICYKILEKSCTTNSYIDELFASSHDEGLGEDLQQISTILEADVHRLLDPIVGIPTPPGLATVPTASARKSVSQNQRQLVKRYNMLKRIARAKRRLLLHHRSRKQKASPVHT